MDKNFFTRYASLSAVAAGVFGFLYAVSFVVLKNPDLSSMFLTASGLFAFPVMVGLYAKLKETEANFALLAFVLGIAGSVGYLLHGGYDLANVFNPPASINLDLPNQVDPRGLLAFGVTGLSILKFSWLITKSKKWPDGLGQLGVASGVLLIIIYVARLVVLSPSSPILLYPVLLEGFVVNPVWYLWLGFAWSKGLKF